jgi:HD-GYP domain-containing protein (c-di-GMP phosphodiesterase class II)
MIPMIISSGEGGDATSVLQAARECERAARIPEAMEGFAAAIALGEQEQDRATVADAARRLAVLHQQRGDPAEARRLCEWSRAIATNAGLGRLAAEAQNTMGVLHMMGGEPTEARRAFEEALRGGHAGAEVRARVEQNLGVLVNIQGDLDRAMEHYGRSLAAYRELGDQRGCAIAYHNLGMVSADRGDARAAERDFRESLAIATRLGDPSLRGLCLVSIAELEVEGQRFEDAREHAEEALGLFKRLEAQRGCADAYRVIGMVYRETGRIALAESRLQRAIEIAVGAGATLIEAEACRDIGLLHQATGRNVDALRALTRAHHLFRRLDARRDAVNVGGRMTDLQATFMRVVREWGESIESSDSHTYGHCERVAQDAVAVCRALDLDASAETTVLLGAYLHDVGMVRVPHEILRSNVPLSRADAILLERHPVWGLQLLSGVDFPWDLKPIVRWHHERRDGTGYPDGLCGDAIPIGAQIVGLLDAYDQLLTGRFGRPPLCPEAATSRILDQRHYWSDPVVEAFVRACGRTSARRPS